MKYRKFISSDTNVSKFVFEQEAEGKNKAIAVEAVLYRYNSYKERTVICCSTQSGCTVGCAFCGTGKFFIRSLTADEIIEQIKTVISTIDCATKDINKFQIMFMSMGEPFLNYSNVEEAIIRLNLLYPNAQLLISTSAPNPATANHFEDFIKLSKRINKVGIQFSVHESTDKERAKLIPTRTTSIKSIGYLGEKWAKEVGRRPFFNYCVHDGNNTESDANNLKIALNPDVWECTLSVICEKNNTVKNAIEQQLDIIKLFSNKLINLGYSLRVFNPAGQDDIGGGCGQLWYFQDWLKKQNK